MGVVACASRDNPVRSFEVSTQDVHRFVDVMHRNESDWDCRALRPYFDSASAGLRAYDRKFHVGVDELWRALKSQPARYEKIGALLPALDSAATQVRAVFARYRTLDPDARMPDAYFVVGNGIAAGTTKRDAYAEAHEAELWRDFQRDMDSRDYRRWFYDGRDSVGRGGWPPDLGYWIGYRIARSFFYRRSDSAGALHDILTIRDFHDFLARSGYDGGRPQPATKPL
jgi:hypothetical protein